MQFFFGINRPLRVLLITNSIVVFASAMLGPLYAIFVNRVGGDLLDAGLTSAVFLGTTGITMYLAGGLLDRIKRRRPLLVGAYLALAFGFLSYLFVGTIAELFAVQFFLGLANAVYAPAMDTLYADHIARTKAGRSWAMLEVSESMGASIGAVAGGFLATYFGFDSVFVTMSLLCLASAFYALFMPRTKL